MTGKNSPPILSPRESNVLSINSINLEKHEPELSGRSETVLPVENEASVRDRACTIIRHLGYRVLSASNGGEAFLLAEKCMERVDLLMTDVVMPGMNGRKLAERLIRIQPDMKVLFTSGYRENVVVHHGIVDEKLDFIGKPYTMQSLAQKIRDVLGPGSR